MLKRIVLAKMPEIVIPSLESANTTVLLETLASLDGHQRRQLCWHLVSWKHGLGRSAPSAELLGRRLTLSEDEIYALETDALEELCVLEIEEIR
jgi:hypothetical protein